MGAPSAKLVESPSYVYRVEGRCIGLIHGDSAPSDHEWSTLIADIQRVAAAGRGACLLVYASGDGTPNAKQRARLGELSGVPFRTGIVSDSRVVRTIVTAVSWIQRQPIRAFSVASASDVLDFLELSAAEKNIMRSLMTTVCSESGHRQSLTLL